MVHIENSEKLACILFGGTRLVVWYKPIRVKRAWYSARVKSFGSRDEAAGGNQW